MAFSYKLGCLPENVLQTLLNDRLVAKGSVMGFVTTFFQVRAGLFETFHIAAAVQPVQQRDGLCDRFLCVRCGFRDVLFRLCDSSSKASSIMGFVTTFFQVVLQSA